MKLTRKRIAVGGVAVLVVAGAVALLRPAPLSVDTARVARGPLQVTVDEEGETRVRDRYVVSAPVAGRVARIELREGDPVAPGAVVARVFPAPLDARAREQASARVEAAEDAQRAAGAGVAQARAALEQAQRSCRRAQDLAAKGLIAPEERERAELEEATRARELESAEFRAQAAAHDVQVARAALLAETGNAIPLRSPIRGQVLRIPERSERVVLAGAPLAELGDPAKLEIVADLLSSDAVKVKPGDAMLIEGWGGGTTLSGRLRVVEPSGFTKVSALGVEEQRVNVVGDFVDPPGALGDRYRVEIRVVVWQADDILKVPASALFRHGDGWSVFAVAEGRARRRELEVGHRTPFDAEIVQGLNEGDVVIRHPSDRIAEGVRVSAR
ncbi:MAG TPA: efflux RND transporter periplasmic adaptor subunit [Gemmatimonadales bacterium]|nr:efflux RND transporter periplasmic adaptor subunit [Gemmatimonadales bacterium]